MCYHHLDIFTYKMDGGIEGAFSHIVIYQVEKPVSGEVTGIVEVERKTGVQVGVVLYHCFYELGVVPVAFEDLFVCGKFHECSIFLSAGTEIF